MGLSIRAIFGMKPLARCSEPSCGKSYGLFGRTKGHSASHNHSYISYGWPRTLVLPSGNLLLWQVRSFLADKPLQLSLSDKSFYLLFQVIAVNCVMIVAMVEVAVLVFGPLIGISLQLARKC